MLKTILILVLALAAFVVVIRSIEGRSIFFPMKGRSAPPEGVFSCQDVFFGAADGVKLHGWFIPADGSTGNEFVVLFLHGNAGNIGHRSEKIQILRQTGVSIFIIDYRGYGLSGGKPSERGIYKDVEAAYAWVLDQGISAERVILYGESIGGAFAVDLAAKKPVKAVIIEDTFTSVPAMVRRMLPWMPPVVLGTRLDSLSKIDRVSAEKLFFHSLDDEIIPYEMGKQLFDQSPQPKSFVELRGGHNSAFLEDYERYWAGLSGFIGKLSRL